MSLALIGLVKRLQTEVEELKQRIAALEGRPLPAIEKRPVGRPRKAVQ